MGGKIRERKGEDKLVINIYFLRLSMFVKKKIQIHKYVSFRHTDRQTHTTVPAESLNTEGVVG